jgi:hypothetical protein
LGVTIFGIFLTPVFYYIISRFTAFPHLERPGQGRDPRLLGEEPPTGEP